MPVLSIFDKRKFTTVESNNIPKNNREGERRFREGQGRGLGGGRGLAGRG